ncbi:hypothetical protein BGZ60DRAFT_552643 [Tricladium varicosporioides]|nr:hypothetical protein BGZ60DRAFT_552643 [Hymenoscyphus varicosporioides]
MGARKEKKPHSKGRRRGPLVPMKTWGRQGMATGGDNHHHRYRDHSRSVIAIADGGQEIIKTKDLPASPFPITQTTPKEPRDLRYRAHNSNSLHPSSQLLRQQYLLHAQHGSTPVITQQSQQSQQTYAIQRNCYTRLVVRRPASVFTSCIVSQQQRAHSGTHSKASTQKEIREQRLADSQTDSTGCEHRKDCKDCKDHGESYPQTSSYPKNLSSRFQAEQDPEHARPAGSSTSILRAGRAVVSSGYHPSAICHLPSSVRRANESNTQESGPTPSVQAEPLGLCPAPKESTIRPHWGGLQTTVCHQARTWKASPSSPSSPSLAAPIFTLDAPTTGTLS